MGEMGISEEREERAGSLAERRRVLKAKAQELRTKGYSNAAIAQTMDLSESTVRVLLVPPPVTESIHRETVELGKALTDSGLTVDQATQKIRDAIRKEQGFETDKEAQDYWFTLTFADKIALTKRVVK